MKAIFGPPKIPESSPIIVRKGKVNNVSYLDPIIVEIPFYKHVYLERIKVRRVAPISNELTYITIWSKDPESAGFDPDLHEVCKLEFAPDQGDRLGLDDLLTGITYISDDGVDLIWLTIAPENGSSNYYIVQLSGRKESVDTNSTTTPFEITVP